MTRAVLDGHPSHALEPDPRRHAGVAHVLRLDDPSTPGRGAWRMKCPACGHYMSKFAPDDPWRCPFCGWNDDLPKPLERRDA